MHFSTFISGAALFHTSIAGYVLQDDYMKDFFSNFDFFTAADPTNGHVKFVDQATATSAGLINATSGNAVSWGVDTKNKAPDGRQSIRITSKKSYNTGLVILDVEHMPTGCGTWPAFWMVGPNWPNSGEIDILEGVNEQTNNAMTLHTGAGCSISSSAGAFTGSVQTSNCDVKAANQDENAGCSIKDPSTQSYGAGLNGIQGGVYATQWTDEAISVWFFPRSKIPKDALGSAPDPTGWGNPSAKFSGACDIATTFKQQQIVFDTTFCGDWAGNVWTSGSCASKAATCNDYVSNTPSAFTNAYWTINSLKVYSDNGNAAVSSSAVSPAPSSTKKPVTSAVSSKISSVIPVPSASIPKSSSIVTPIVPTVPGLSSIAPVSSLPLSGTPVASIVPTVAPGSLVSGGPSGSPSSRPHRSHSRSAGASGASSLAQDTVVPIPTATQVNGAALSGFGWPSGGAGSKTLTAQASGTGAPVGTPSASYTLPNGSLSVPAGTGTSVPTPIAPIAQDSTLATPATITNSFPALPLSSVLTSLATLQSLSSVNQVPASSGTAVPTTIVTRPSSAVASASAVAPSGVNGEMSAFHWPVKQSTGAAAPSASSVVPTSAAPVSSEGAVAVVIPASSGAVAEETPIPTSTTVPPVPRHARHAREHRRRLTQHHARR